MMMHHKSHNQTTLVTHAHELGHHNPTHASHASYIHPGHHNPIHASHASPIQLGHHHAYARQLVQGPRPPFGRSATNHNPCPPARPGPTFKGPRLAAAPNHYLCTRQLVQGPSDPRLAAVPSHILPLRPPARPGSLGPPFGRDARWGISSHTSIP